MESAALLASLNSFCFDYLSRGKTPGNHITDYIIRQLPVLPPVTYARPCPWAGRTPRITDWLRPRVLELTYTAWDLEAFAQDCGWSGPPFRWDEDRRFLLRCELDAAFFRLYLPAAANGEWRVASRELGNPHDETPEQLAELKKHFPTPPLSDAIAAAKAVLDEVEAINDYPKRYHHNTNANPSPRQWIATNWRRSLTGR